MGFLSWPADYGMAKTNYAAVAGSCGTRASTAAASYGPNANLSQYAGVFGNRTKTTLVGISDGTSNTLLYGEGTTPDDGVLQWNWMSTPAITTLLGISTSSKSSNTAYRFTSHHLGIVQFSMADGSVRGLRPGGSTTWNPASTDWTTLQQMAGKADGATYNPAALGN